VIASLTGNVVALDSGSAVIDVSGVGYLVQISQTTSAALKLHSSTSLYTALIVREDGFTLFGFLDSAEQKVFDLLRSVSGVGPKSALAILGVLSVDQIAVAVAQANDAAFKAVSGIGPKTAKLIVVTLAGKMGNSKANASVVDPNDSAIVISALTGLGWNEKTAIDAANRAAAELGKSANTNEILKFALSSLGSSKSVGASDE
jgi:Holliday junction DNA helicase RuvA